MSSGRDQLLQESIKSYNCKELIIIHQEVIDSQLEQRKSAGEQESPVTANIS